MKQLVLGSLILGILLIHTTVIGQHKPIALHPENGHYFLFRGKPIVLITTGEHYGSVLNLDFDYITYLNTLQKDSLNYTRIFTGSYVEDPGAFNISNNTLAPAPGRFTAPWARSSTPGYDNGGNKFDLTKWDEAYVSRLKNFITEASKRGIVVEVTMFSSLYGAEGWKSSPLNPKNNINHTDTTLHKKVNTLGNGNILKFQEQMVRKIVRELREFDNVIYEIQNEPWADNGKQVAVSKTDTARPDWQTKVESATDSSLAWQQYIASVITDEEKTYAAKHLIAQNMTSFVYKLPIVDPNVSIFNFHYAKPEAVTENYSLNKVIGFDESGFAGSADSTYRKEAWRFIMAGGGLFNNLDYSFTVAKPNGTEKQEAPGGGSVLLRKQLSILKRYIEKMDFIHLNPDHTLAKQIGSGRVYTLANQGKEYAIYVENTTNKKLSLQLPAGQYALTWVSPETGTTKTSSNIKHTGGVISLTNPMEATEVALHIRLVK